MITRIPFVQFLLDAKNEATNAFFKTALAEVPQSLDRYINGLNREMMATLKINYFGELQQVYLDILVRSHCTNPKADADMAQLSAHSEDRIAYFLNLVLMVACAELLESDGTLKSAVKTEFQRRDMFKHVKDQAKDSPEHKDDKDDQERFIRDKLVSGFASGIIKCLSTELFNASVKKAEKLAEDKAGMKERHDISKGLALRNLRITQDKLDAAIDAHKAHFAALAKLQAEQPGTHQLLVADMSAKKSKTFAEYIKFAELGLIFHSHLEAHSRVMQDPLFLKSITIREFYYHRCTRLLDGLNAKLVAKYDDIQKTPIFGGVNSAKSYWQEVQPYVVAIQKQLSKLKTEAEAKLDGAIILAAVKQIKSLGKLDSNDRFELVQLHEFAEMVAPRLYRQRTVLRYSLGLPAQNKVQTPPAQRSPGLFGCANKQGATPVMSPADGKAALPAGKPGAGRPVFALPGGFKFPQ